MTRRQQTMGEQAQAQIPGYMNPTCTFACSKCGRQETTPMQALVTSFGYMTVTPNGWQELHQYPYQKIYCPPCWADVARVLDGQAAT